MKTNFKTKFTFVFQQKETRSLLKLISKFKDSVEGSWSYAREFLVAISDHCECFSRTCLTVGKDADIVAIYSWLYQVLQWWTFRVSQIYFSVRNFFLLFISSIFLLVSNSCKSNFPLNQSNFSSPWQKSIFITIGFISNWYKHRRNQSFLTF